MTDVVTENERVRWKYATVYSIQHAPGCNGLRLIPERGKCETCGATVEQELGTNEVEIVGSSGSVNITSGSPDERRLLESADAAVWAEEFCESFGTERIDFGLMVAWFANAMQTATRIALESAAVQADRLREQRDKLIEEVDDLERQLHNIPVGRFAPGRYYRHNTGEMMHTLTIERTDMWGVCLLAENDKGTIAPCGLNEDNAENWFHATRNQWLAKLGKADDDSGVR